MASAVKSYQEAVKNIALNLNLKGGDEHSQDWEYEVADSSRIEDFLEFYVDNKLDTVEKRILIKLLLEAYNDYVGKKGFNSNYTEKIKKILKEEKRSCEDILCDWLCEGEELEDAFYITPVIREIVGYI